jgi:hypothetical protein
MTPSSTIGSIPIPGFTVSACAARKIGAAPFAPFAGTFAIRFPCSSIVHTADSSASSCPLVNSMNRASFPDSLSIRTIEQNRSTKRSPMSSSSLSAKQHGLLLRNALPHVVREDAEYTRQPSTATGGPG